MQKFARDARLLYDTKRMIERVGDCIWKVIGTEPGPTVVVFGGVHGNELTGIEVVRKMHKMFVGDGRDRPMQLNRGTLYLILGNPKAIDRNTRGSEDHADLNRCFTRDVLTPSPFEALPAGRQREGGLPSEASAKDGGRGVVSYEHARARELAKILLTADISIDLHSTNKPSVPFLCCAVDDAHEKIFQWFDCDRVLADPHYILGGEPVTTDEFVDLHGGVGICYETGQSKDVSRIDEVLSGVMNVLMDQGMIGRKQRAGNREKGSGVRKYIYELVSVINLTEAGFRYEGTLGGGSFEAFSIGQTIGYIGDEPIVAEFDGVIVFPKIPELQTLGKPVVYLSKRIS